MPTLFKRPDLSVIVPVFNLEKYIGKLIDCFKRQELGKYTVEFIFVLNNCTDKSEEVIRESGFDCTILNCTEQGCGCARNTGFEVSKGDYIWFIDGDDWLLTDTAIKEALDTIDGDILRIQYTSDLWHRQYFSMVWQYVFKRDFIKDLRFRQKQPSEDDAYMKQIYERLGISTKEPWMIPATDNELYYYNYLRPGSNMERHFRGEDINIPPSA